MILVGKHDSPVTRRVAVALHHYGMPFTRDTRSIFGEAEAVAKISPLSRVPALILDDGEVLIDSAAILDYLDEVHWWHLGHHRRPKHPGGALDQLPAPLRDLVWMHVVLVSDFGDGLTIGQRIDGHLGLERR